MVCTTGDLDKLENYQEYPFLIHHTKYLWAILGNVMHETNTSSHLKQQKCASVHANHKGLCLTLDGSGGSVASTVYGLPGIGLPS